MEKEATKIFRIVLDDAASINKDIQLQFYKILDLDGKKLSIYENENVRIKEEIKTSIEGFSFNLQELDFLAQLKEIIEDEMKKLQTTENYNLMQDSLLERLKKLRNVDISLEDDFKELSSRVANPFVSRDMFYNYFIARKNKITDMIKLYNQTIINSLITLTPKLIEELKRENPKEITQKQVQQTQQQATTTSSNLENLITNIDTKIKEINGEKKKDDTSQEKNQVLANSGNVTVNPDQIINACKVKYNELQRRLSYLSNGNYGSGSRINTECAQLRHVISQLDDFIKVLSIEKNTQDLIEKYSNETNPNKVIESIISEAVPRMTELNSLTNEVDHIYGKNAKLDYSQYELPHIDFEMLHNRITTSISLKDLLAGKKTIEQWLGNLDYDTNQRLKEEYNFLIDKIITLSMENEKKKNPNPDPTPSAAAVGKSKSDVEYLVKSNNFYGVLQGIKNTDLEKYKDFIMLGFNSMINKWQQQAELCNTFIEREKSYRDFAELYENFKDYLPIEVVNMLNQNLEEIKKYIEQQKTKNTEKVEVRYNTSKQEQVSSAIKR